jgi:myosin-1
MSNSSPGWWLARPRGSSPDDTSVQGWVPSAYVEEIIPPSTSAPPPPPPPPPPPAASRPVPTPFGNGSNASNGRPLSGKPTPPVPPTKRPAKRVSAVGSEPVAGGNSMAGSLAEALKARQAAMGGAKRREEGGGDW